MNTTLVSNLYLDFMKEYKSRLVQICTQNKIHNSIILLDFDVFSENGDFEKSLYFCTKCKFPEYARNKIEEFQISGKQNIVALKHIGLCLIAIV